MVGLWPGVLALLACLTDCLAVQSPAAAEVEWPPWGKKKPQNKTAGKEETSSKKISVTTAPPKPKRIFSDVADRDFEPDNLAQEEKTESPKDWSLEEDDPSPELEADGAVWTDPDMSSHNPHLRHGERKPCIAKTSIIAEDGHLFHDWLKQRMALHEVGCRHTVIRCDPIDRDLSKFSAALEPVDHFSEKHLMEEKLHLIEETHKFITNFGADTSAFQDFAEFFWTLPKENHMEITLHALHLDPGSNAFARYGMGTDTQELWFEICDNDMSGGISFNELQDCMYAHTVICEYDLFKPECPTKAARFAYSQSNNRVLSNEQLRAFIGEHGGHPDPDKQHFFKFHTPLFELPEHLPGFG